MERETPDATDCYLPGPGRSSHPLGPLLCGFRAGCRRFPRTAADRCKVSVGEMRASARHVEIRFDDDEDIRVILLIGDINITTRELRVSAEMAELDLEGNTLRLTADKGKTVRLERLCGSVTTRLEAASIVFDWENETIRAEGASAFGLGD